MNQERLDYIKTINEQVQKTCTSFGLFPSLCIAQAILESANGQSELARVSHNHFSIKADKSWNGATLTMYTREVIKGKPVVVPAKFRSYDNFEQGLNDRCNFLKSNPRYIKSGVFAAKTPEEQAEALKEGGYATDPKYVELLCSIMKTYNLKQYDKDFHIKQ